MQYTPNQGDIVLLNFDPQKGREQKGRRPGLIVSNNEFYARTKMALVCPITNTISKFPMHVALDARTKTTGEIMCEQVKCLDIGARDVSYEEMVPEEIMDEVIDLICSFVE